ncbi:MAG: ABC transporter permease [Acidimicrobiales bacterium]
MTLLADSPPVAVLVPPRRTQRLRGIGRRFRGQKMALVALGFIGLVVAAGLAAPLLPIHDPNAQVLSDRLKGFSGEHLLGTDDLGRDVLSRLLVGARVTLLAAIQATAIASLLGAPVGLVAGYVGGWVDVVTSRIADAVLSIPGFLLALAIVGILEPGVTNAMIAVGLVYAPRFFRVVRASTLAVREEAYVDAARALGVNRRRIIAGHVLPNIASPLAVELALAAGFALLAEAGISFLGLGVQPPQASWGSMLGRSTRFMSESPLLVVLPGLAIFLLVLAVNVVGNGLRDALSPEHTNR